MQDTPSYLTAAQQRRLSQWERWNRNYFLFAFAVLAVILVFSSQMGLSSGNEWSSLGLIIAILVAPIVILQLRLSCPACGHRIGWQAKLQAPDQCRNCHTFLRARS